MSDIMETIMTPEENCIGKKCDICGKEAFGKDAEKWGDFSAKFKTEEEGEKWKMWNICSESCWYKAFKKSIDEKAFEIIEMPYEFAKKVWDGINF